MIPYREMMGRRSRESLAGHENKKKENNEKENARKKN